MSTPLLTVSPSQTIPTETFPFEVEGGGITSPGGFQASGVHAGLKKRKKDLTLLCSETPAMSPLFLQPIS